MDNFFEKMETMFKEFLDHPVPALLYDENKKILLELKNTEGQYNFSKDITEGEKAENLVRNFLIAQGYTFVSKNTTAEYDLLMLHNGIEVRFEVKCDFKVQTTGNIAIEEECRGKLSGINVWNCEFVVYVLPHKGIKCFIKLSTLKELIANLKSRKIGKTHKGGGDDGSDTVNYLMPFNHFEKHCKIMPI